MSDTPSFQDLLNNFSEEIFVGRGEQLAMFEQVFKLSRPPFLVLNVSGQGGVGKTTLLEQYQRIAANHHAHSAVVNEDYTSIPPILSRFAKQFGDSGITLSGFNERYHKYQELKAQVESDPKAPSGLLNFALRSATRIGLRSLKRVPIAGEVTDILISPETEEIIAEQTGAFAQYIAQKFTNKDEKVLLLETDAELTRHFIADLNKFADKNKVILFFDTFEKTAPIIEKWLIDLLAGNFGSFSGNILFVIAGRYPLGQEWTRYRKAVRQIELHEFTETEAKDYLVRAGISDEKQISQIIEISNRLPVLLALLVSAPSELPQDVTGDAVERFLQGTTREQREAALVASLPRFFNQDILSVILGENDGKKAFEWLIKAHFVRAGERGWVYHDVVRSLMLRYFRLRSKQQYVVIHKKLAEYYENLEINFGITTEKSQKNDLWRKFELERLYHYLYENPQQNIESTVQIITDGVLDLVVKISDESKADDDAIEGFDKLINGCSIILTQIAEETLELDLKKFAEKYEQLIKGFNSKLELQEMIEVFNWLNNLQDLNNDQRSITYFLAFIRKSDNTKNKSNEKYSLDDINKAIQLAPEFYFYYLTRGIANDEKEDYPAALADISKAIELQPEKSDNYLWRGSIYYQLEDYPAALADYSKAIELQPEKSDSYLWRGIVYYQLEDYPAALADYSKAIELQPEDGNNYFWRGRTYYQLEDYPAALTDISKAIELQPEDGYNYYWRGRTYYQLEDYPAALTDFSKAIELQPKDGYNYFWRGRTHYQLEDHSTALEDFSEAIKIDANDNWSLYRRGLIYGLQGNKKDFKKDISAAIKLAKFAYEKDINNWNNVFALAIYYLASGENENAEELYQHAVKNCTQKKKLQNGLEHLDDFIILNPKHKHAKSIRTLLHQSLDRVNSVS